VFVDEAYFHSIHQSYPCALQLIFFFEQLGFLIEGLRLHDYCWISFSMIVPEIFIFRV